MGSVFPSPGLEATFPGACKGAGLGLSAELPDKRHRTRQLGFLVAPVIRPLSGQQRAPRQVPDVAHKNVSDRPVETMTGLDLECNRLSRSLPCREGYRPLLQVVGRDRLCHPIKGYGHLDAPVGMPPHLDRMISLKNDPITIILSYLEDGVVGVGVFRVLRLEGSNLFQVIFLEDQLAIDLGEGRRRQMSPKR